MTINNMATTATVCKDVLVYWRVFTILIIPIVLSPLIFILHTQAAYCAYVVSLMALFWILELLPLPITALIPMLLYPILGVVKAKDLAKLYLQDTTMVFMAGLMFALVMENVNLHKRIGTGILLKIGTTPSRILIGLLLPTWFLSMFISNTAATSMMIAAAGAVVRQLTLGMKMAKLRSEKIGNNNEVFEMENIVGKDATYANPVYVQNGIVVDVTNDNNNDVDNDSTNNNNNSINKNNNNNNINNKNYEGYIKDVDENDVDNDKNNDKIEDKDEDNDDIGDKDEDNDDIDKVVLDREEQTRVDDLSQMLSLAIAYSANIGGTGTITGTPTNLLVFDAIDRLFQRNHLKSPITYATWFFFVVPISCCCLILLWLWLQLYYLKGSCWRQNKSFKAGEKAIGEVMRDEYKKLGSISFGEITTSVLLVLMVLLWLLRDPGFVTGYETWFKPRYVTDSTPAMMIALLLFVLPMQKPDWMCWRKDLNVRAQKRRSLLTWEEVSTRLPWGPIILLGGGFAMAEGCRVSGLTELIGKQLGSLSSLQPWILVLLITITISFITEIMSNTAIITLFLPILEAMSLQLNINPLYLMLPAGLSSSFAFMLPIATPPNAIVFSFANLTVLQMMKVGFIMNCLCVGVVTLGLNTWGIAMFDLASFPFPPQNYTLPLNCTKVCVGQE